MQIKYKYSMEEDNNIKFLLANIGKMKNIAQIKLSAIAKTVPLNNPIISKRKSDISIREI